jgi:hypothetical protein
MTERLVPSTLGHCEEILASGLQRDMGASIIRRPAEPPETGMCVNAKAVGGEAAEGAPDADGGHPTW